MRYKKINYVGFVAITVPFIVILSFLFISKAECKDIGTFLHVIGQVFHLKDNKSPEMPAKINAGVSLGDGILTKEASRAHLKLIDTSELFIAPKSDIVLDYYYINPYNDRMQTLSTLVKRGLIHLIVNFSKIFPSESLIKTDYSLIGVRGTDLYVLIGKNFTDIFVKKGLVSVVGIQNRNANNRQYNLLEKQVEIRAGGGGGGGGERGALKGATSIGEGSLLGPNQAVRVIKGMPPSKVVDVPLEYFDRLEKLMIVGMPDSYQEGKDPKHLLELIGPIQ